MALNLNKIKQRKLETTQSGNLYKPKSGVKNMIRIFKFSHLVTKEDVVNGYFNKDQIGKVVEELDRPVTRHYNVTAGSKIPVISNRRIMKMYKELANSSDKADQDKAKDIRPSTNYFVNVVDLDNVEKGVKLYAVPKSVYNKITTYIIDPEYGGEALLGCNGRDFVVEYDKNADPQNMYQVMIRAEGRSAKLPADLQKSVTDLYSEEAYSQMGNVETEDSEEEAAVPTEEEQAVPTTDDPEPPPVPLKGKPTPVRDVVDDIFDSPPPARKAAPAKAPVKKKK